MKSEIMQDRNDIMSVDAMMDERYGKVGTPEREAFRKEAYVYFSSESSIWLYS